VHAVGDEFGVEVVDGVAGVVEDDEVELVVAVVAVLEDALELLLAGQPPSELRVIFIEQFDYLLQALVQPVARTPLLRASRVL
jgi:hypothetical protein